MATPPPFLQLAGHPLRWRLLSELARSDLRVGELCARAGKQQSLVSYHLRRLRDGSRFIPDMVASMYKGIDPRLHGAAGRSVLAHLVDLERRGLVRGEGDSWSLAA